MTAKKCNNSHRATRSEMLVLPPARPCSAGVYKLMKQGITDHLFHSAHRKNDNDNDGVSIASHNAEKRSRENTTSASGPRDPGCLEWTGGRNWLLLKPK